MLGLWSQGCYNTYLADRRSFGFTVRSLEIRSLTSGDSFNFLATG